MMWGWGRVKLGTERWVFGEEVVIVLHSGHLKGILEDLMSFRWMVSSALFCSCCSSYFCFSSWDWMAFESFFVWCNTPKYQFLWCWCCCVRELPRRTFLAWQQGPVALRRTIESCSEYSWGCGCGCIKIVFAITTSKACRSKQFVLECSVGPLR